LIEQIIQNPLYLAVIVGGGAGAASLLVYRSYVDNEEETIETEGMEKRLQKIFKTPTSVQGGKIRDIVKQRSVSNTPKTIGYAVRAKKHSVQVINEFKDDGSYETEKVEGTNYDIIEGSGGFFNLDLKLKAVGYELGLKNFAETYDVPQSLIVPGDEYIWMKPEAHFIKYNGVKRQLSAKGMGRVWNSSFAGLTENYMDTLQDIPEQLQDLNNRVAGQKRIMNQKSENIQSFQEQKDREEKDL